MVCLTFCGLCIRVALCSTCRPGGIVECTKIFCRKCVHLFIATTINSSTFYHLLCHVCIVADFCVNDCVRYNVGDSFPAGDGCNTWYVRNTCDNIYTHTVCFCTISTCQAGGKIACTEIACREFGHNYDL